MDSSTDWGANKQELVYARTVCMGRSRTFFVGLQDLQAGTAVAILAAYMQVMLCAGLPVGWCKTTFGEIHMIIEISLCASVIEGGWSQVNFVKGYRLLI